VKRDVQPDPDHCGIADQLDQYPATLRSPAGQRRSAI
jgi:hypothetical protein